MTDPQLPDSQVISISEWISSRLWVDYGVPFAFDGRPYLRKIHDLDEKKILFRTGRQVEKTSSLAAKLVSHSCMRTNWKSLYVSPSQGQTRVFSHARLDRVLQSPYVKAKYFNSEQCIDFVYEKQFMNGSSVLLSYASTDADRCRGISADMLLCDEIQDMTTDVFPVLEQCLSHSPWGYKVYAGTPKTLNNSMETHWKNSTQCEWMIHCGGCGKWIFQDEKMIRKEGPRCPDCSRELDPQFGKWVAYGAEDSEFVGFRIPQTMVPWMLHPHKWKELYQNFTKWPQQQFYNEVLGLAHERGANPLVEEDLKKCCSDRTMVEHRPVDLYFDALYAGVDWGAGLGSYTVLFILGWHGGKVHVLYARRFAAEKDEPGIQVDEIAKTCARFATPLVACDWGGGFAQNKSLAMQLSGHGDVVQMCESGVKKRDLSYIQASRMYTFNRSMGMSMVIQGIKNGDYVFPRWEDFKDFAPDFINIFEDYNRALRQVVYDHPDNSPDDAMHSLMFATLAMKLARGDKAL